MMKGLKILLKIMSLIFYWIVESNQSEMIIGNGDYEADDTAKINGLEVVIKHCANRKSDYKQLSIIVNGEREPSVNFYKKLHEDSIIPVQVSSGFETLNSIDWKSCTMLWLSRNEIDHLLKTLEKFSPKASNLLLIYSPDKSQGLSLEEIRNAGLTLWKEKYIHKLIFAANDSCVFFDPFEPKFPELNSFGALKNLSEESTGLIDDRDDFLGYEINVAIFPYLTAKKVDGIYDGCAGNTMREITKRMNVTTRLHEPKEMFGWVADDGTVTGSLGRIVYHRSDVTFNEFFVKNYATDDIDFTTYLNTDQICAIVSKRGKIPSYLLIIRIFSPLSWVIIFLGNSFVALIYLGIKDVVSFSQSRFKLENNFRETSCRYRDKFSSIQRFVFSWIFFCFYPMKSETKWFGERIHVALGLLFGIVIGGCFTSKLASSFSKPVYLKDIDTLKDLDESGLQILTTYPNLLMDVFVDDESATLKNLHKKLQLKNEPEVKRHTYVEKNGAFLEREHSIVLKEAFFTPVELHLVPDCPRQYSLAYLISRGSPFKKRLDTLIGRLNFSGIYSKWFNDMTKGPEEPSKSKKPVVIQLQHLLIPFFILFLGLGIATIVFYSEQRGVKGTKPL